MSKVQEEKEGRAIEKLREELEKQDLNQEKEKIIDEESSRILQLKENKFDRGLLNVTTVLFIIMNLLVWSQVLTRLIGASLNWTEEIARYLFVICTFWGAAIALRKDEHIRITTIVDMFPLRVREFLEFIGYIMVTFFVVVITIGAFNRAAGTWGVPIASIPKIKRGYIYAILGIGLLFNLYYLFQWLLIKFKIVVKGFSEVKKQELENQ